MDCVVVFVFLYTAVLLPSIKHALVEEKPYPPKLHECFLKMTENKHLPQSAGESIVHHCVNTFLSTTASERFSYNVSSAGMEWVQSLLMKYTEKPRHRRQAFYRRRKEYRMLTDAERKSYHTAIQRLKADKSIAPNRYDFLASLHTGAAIPSAHNGPNFYGWHRIYLLIYEDALREMVPGVTVPYWDSTLDFDLPDPTLSVIWTSGFLGNGDGAVTTGPFANWQTASGPLTRNTGSSSRLYSKEVLETIMTRTTMADISYPNAPIAYNLEYHHGGPHNWVDGQMAGLETAPHDPVFYMHHAYVDYLWELFRIRQRKFGIDPSSDYPINYGEAVHAPGNRMDGFPRYTNIQGYDDYWMAALYTYDQSPSCSVQRQSCGSNYLRCDMPRSRCISADRSAVGEPNETDAMLGPEIPISSAMVRIKIGERFIAPPSDGRSRMRRSMESLNKTSESKLEPILTSQRISAPPVKQQMSTYTNETDPNSAKSAEGNRKGSGMDICPKSIIGGSYQNTFNINGISDINLWVYLPVTVIRQRVYGSTYKSFPVLDGKISKGDDIYFPPAHSFLHSYLNFDNFSSSSDCATSSSGAGKVYIQSDGLNYMGRYKDYAIVDNRQPFTKSTSYVAVKNPLLGSTTAILSAYDSCGRICHPRCQVQGTEPTVYLPCSGVVEVTPASPKQYGTTYADAVSSVWNFRNNNCPASLDVSISVTFYCTNDETWPWSS